jgi:hypothetical protein
MVPGVETRLITARTSGMGLRSARHDSCSSVAMIEDLRPSVFCAVVDMIGARSTIKQRNQGCYQCCRVGCATLGGGEVSRESRKTSCANKALSKPKTMHGAE